MLIYGAVIGHDNSFTVTQCHHTAEVLEFDTSLGLYFFFTVQLVLQMLLTWVRQSGAIWVANEEIWF